MYIYIYIHIKDENTDSITKVFILTFKPHYLAKFYPATSDSAHSECSHALNDTYVHAHIHKFHTQTYH